jgi:hypothetical protein
MVMKRLCVAFGLLLLTWTGSALAQTPADSAAIVETALNYVDGFYTGGAARMEVALHPELAKRIVVSSPGQARVLTDMTAEQLIAATASGAGGQIPEENRLDVVTILDIYRGAASVKIVASDWIDYLHVAKYDGDWKIINVLWKLKPRG